MIYYLGNRCFNRYFQYLCRSKFPMYSRKNMNATIIIEIVDMGHIKAKKIQAEHSFDSISSRVIHLK